MIKYLHFVLAILVLQSCKPIYNETDLSNNHIQGKVKSILLLNETTDIYSGREMYVLFETSKYNELGFITRYESYSPQGEMQTAIEYFYDSKNYCVRAKSDNPKGSPFSGYETFYTYNWKGLPVKEIERSIIDSRDRTTTTYKYDRKGNVTEIKEDEIDETFIERHEYTYGNRGLIVEEREYNNSKLSMSRKYSYNVEGQLLQRKDINYGRGEDEKNYSIYLFDLDGNTISYKSYKNEVVSSNHRTKYDQFNNITEDYQQSPDHVLEISHTYQFDRFNNWVKVRSYLNGKPNYTQKREIEYY